MTRRVGFHLTDRCQLDCDHCLRDPGKAALDLPFERFCAALDHGLSLGASHASLTGGEPTLHPEFPALLDEITRREMTWDMVTNGRRFSRVATWLDEAPARHASCRVVTFSLDGATDSTHDAIRGAGQRREVLQAMAQCVGLAIPFETSTAIHARNAHELEALAHEAHALGAGAVRFAMTQPTGTPIDRELYLAPVAWRGLLRRIERLAEDGLPVTLAEGWPRDVDGLCGPLRGDTLHVDLHGHVTLCCLHSGLPQEGPDETDAGDVLDFQITLRRLEEIQQRAIEADRLERSTSGDPWGDFGCNRCLRRFGRPSWGEGGRRGPEARRERWRGAWAPDRRRLTVLS